MKNISYFNVWNIKIADCFSSSSASLKMNFNPYIYNLYYQSNLLIYLSPNPFIYPYKIKYFICNGGAGTAREQTREHSVVTIREWRHINVDKQRTLLAGVDVILPWGAV